MSFFLKIITCLILFPSFTFGLNWDISFDSAEEEIRILDKQIAEIDYMLHSMEKDAFNEELHNNSNKNTKIETLISHEGLNDLAYPYKRINWKIIIWSREIKWADINSFEVIPSTEKCDLNIGYANGYDWLQFDFEDSSMPGWGKKSITLLKWEDVESWDYETLLKAWSRYSKDNSFVYFIWDPITWSDPETFQILKEKGSKAPCHTKWSRISNIYSKDKINVYYWGYKVQGADANSFEIISNNYWQWSFGKDKNKVFYNWKIISSEPENFQILTYPSGSTSHYSKDSKNVYWRWWVQRVDWADAPSFVLVANTGEAYEKLYSWAKDKNQYYFDTRPQSESYARSVMKRFEKKSQYKTILFFIEFFIFHIL